MNFFWTIPIVKKFFTSFELIQVIRMMDCQFEAVIHGKDGLGCWAIEGKVIIHKSQCEVSLNSRARHNYMCFFSPHIQSSKNLLFPHLYHVVLLVQKLQYIFFNKC